MNFLSIALLALVQQAAPTPSTPGVTTEARAAEARYRAAIALHPDVGAYHYSLGMVLERQQRSAEALNAYRRAVELDSMAARHRGGYGELLLKMGDAAAAEPQLAAARQLDPGNVSYRLSYAQALSERDKWTEATAELREARRLDPVDARIGALLSEAEQRGGATFQGYHDLSDFSDEEPALSLPARIIEYVIAAVLIIASGALLAPVLGTLFLLLIQAPLAWSRAAARR